MYSPATVAPGSYERVVQTGHEQKYPFGPSPSAKKVLQEFVGINRYPGFNQDELRNALSDYVNVAQPMRSFAEELNWTTSSTRSRRRCSRPAMKWLYSEPTFGVYRVLSCALRGATVLDAPLNDDFSLDVERILNAVTSRTKLVIICTPDNTYKECPRPSCNRNYGCRTRLSGQRD